MEASIRPSYDEAAGVVACVILPLATTMPIKRLIDPRRMRKALPRGLAGKTTVGCEMVISAIAAHRLWRLCSSGLCLRCAGFKLLFRPAQLLQLEPAALSEARLELIGLGLIAYQKPLYQLLSLEGEIAGAS